MTVTLIGGGPGDSGLITVAGLRALHEADVVLVDRLAPRGLLDELRPEVEIIDVGKQPGHHRVPQHEINEIITSHARAGRNVVRLKGGDPFVFGRGPEEVEACEGAEVACEVIPGVTSAVAVPAAVGIPVTARGIASGFTVLTGHDNLGDAPGGSNHTVILLMGVTGLAASALTLSRTARGPECPVAVIEDGFGPNQRVTIGTLATIAGLAAARGVRSPAVTVVGDVVTCYREP